VPDEQAEVQAEALRNVDELTSSSRGTDLGRICSTSDHKS